MFLIFHLGRPDVLAVGDLGVRKAVMHAYGMERDAAAGGGGTTRGGLAAAPDARRALPLAVAVGRPDLTGDRRRD